MNNEPVAWMVDGVLFTSLGAALNISFDIEQPCIPLYTHQYERPHNTVLVPCDKLAEMQAEIEALKKEAALQRLSDFTQEAEALKAHPVKELHLSLQKNKQTGELLAVTYTDDEHRIVEVLWQRPPVKELTDAEIWSISAKHGDLSWHDHTLNFARAILRKAQEK